MAINVEIISKELIKPSLPTPPHLKNLKLPFLDQISPSIYIPIILFYLPESSLENTRTENYSQSLKHSLSHTLTRFYPLAGRINDDDVSVDCNDAGVEYVEARVQAQISKVIEKPNTEELLAKLIPINPYDHINNVVLLAIQINLFACGGLAVVVCMSHLIADGSSLVSFINSWASQSNRKTELNPSSPDFDSASKLFPPINLSRFKPALSLAQEHVVTTRFVFDEMKIAKLKQELTTTSITPTRVEAVSAFIWKQLINMSKAKNVGNKEKSYVAVHAVNLRPKTSPPLGDQAFGNIWCYVRAASSEDDDEQGGRLRDAIRKIDVKVLQDGKRYIDEWKKLMEEYVKGCVEDDENIEFCCFSSWCRFPFYDVDFGWGRPFWVCTSTTIHHKNLAILMSTRDGDGIEAWVSLEEADVPVFKVEHNLL